MSELTPQAALAIALFSAVAGWLFCDARIRDDSQTALVTAACWLLVLAGAAWRWM